MATTNGRTFVAEETDGKIYEIVTVGGTPRVELFFDVGTAIATNTDRQLDFTNTFHGGLRSVAFHPDFAQNGLFYTAMMETRPTDPASSTYLSDADQPIAADSVLVEWSYDHQANQVDRFSYREVFRIGMPVYDHPIKQIAFNPFAAPGSADYGLLYVGHGDGSVLSATAGGGQNNDALGKVLRIDPTRNGNDSYSVPADNPFVGDAGMIDEAWSIGHRNPHHLSFTNANGAVRLLVAEPGRDNVDEINMIERGGDFGWSEREGTFVHLEAGGIITGVASLPTNDAANGYVYPVVQLGHEGETGGASRGQVVAGGYVVNNGSELEGEYFYSYAGALGQIYHSSLNALEAAVTSLNPGQSPDALTQATVGEASILFDHDSDDTTAALPRENFRDVVDDDPDYDGSGRVDVRFGQGVAGEIYVLNKRNGWIYQVTNSVGSEIAHDGSTCVSRDVQGPAAPRLASSVASGLNFSSVRTVEASPSAGLWRFVNRGGVMFPVHVRGGDFLDGFSNVSCN